MPYFVSSWQIPVRISIDEKNSVDVIVTEPMKVSTWSCFCIVITQGTGGEMNTTQLTELTHELQKAGLISLRFTCWTPDFFWRVRYLAAAVVCVFRSCNYLDVYMCFLELLKTS